VLSSSYTILAQDQTVISKHLEEAQHNKTSGHVAGAKRLAMLYLLKPPNCVPATAIVQHTKTLHSAHITAAIRV